MAELKIEGTHAEQFAQMKNALRDLWLLLKGNGKDGLEADMVTVQKSLVRIDVAMHTSIFWGKMIAGLITLFFLAATAYFTSLEWRKRTELVVPPIIVPHQTTGQLYNARMNAPQYATIKPHYQ